MRERAVRMVLEHTEEHGSQWATIRSIAEKLGMSSETLRLWVRQAAQGMVLEFHRTGPWNTSANLH